MRLSFSLTLTLPCKALKTLASPHVISWVCLRVPPPLAKKAYHSQAAGMVLCRSGVGIMKSQSSVISFKLQTQGCELLCNDAPQYRVKGGCGLQHKRGRLSSVTHLCLHHVYSLHFGLKLLIPSVYFMRSHEARPGFGNKKIKKKNIHNYPLLRNTVRHRHTNFFFCFQLWRSQMKLSLNFFL